MGWCSATRIFDGVIETALETDISDNALEDILTSLYHELVDMDWDCQCESNYMLHEKIKPIMKKLYPCYYEYLENEE